MPLKPKEACRPSLQGYRGQVRRHRECDSTFGSEGEEWQSGGLGIRTNAAKPDLSLRALLPQVQTATDKHSVSLVDVRSPQEFSGEILAPPGLPETCQRGGHIPGAHSIPWGRACKEDGTFLSYDDLKHLYASEGVDGSRPVIAYCRIGERSSHTWFALKYLLGYRDVKNYDGSWTEWGNLVGAHVERGAALTAGGSR